MQYSCEYTEANEHFSMKNNPKASSTFLVLPGEVLTVGNLEDKFTKNPSQCFPATEKEPINQMPLQSFPKRPWFRLLDYDFFLFFLHCE